MQAERSTSQSGGTLDAGDVKASSVPVSTSAGAMANRQYRLATAGADKNVRVSFVRAVP